MTMRFGSIIIHKPDPNSDGNHSSSDDTEVAEIAETAFQKYSTRTRREGTHRKRSERQKRMMAKESQRNISRSSSLSSINSNELPILRGLSAKDKSPPLNRSHYSFPATAVLIDDRLDGIKDSLKNRSQQGQSPAIRRSSTSNVEELNNERLLGFRVLTAGSASRPLDLQQRRASSISVETRLAIAPTTVPENFFNEEEEDSQLNGFTKLFKNLNFAEKRRQQKAERERLNIEKLPNHLKEQLKHIYVY